MFTTGEMTAIDAATGGSSDKFSFIQQVFNKVYLDDTLLPFETVTVTIKLDTGDHFFFSCHNDLYSSYSASFSSTDLTDLCATVTTLK